MSGPLLWWKLRGIVYMLTLWTDCLMSKGEFGDVPAPDLSHTFFFFWPAQLWVASQGSALRDDASSSLSSSSAALGWGVCCSPPCQLGCGGTQLAPLPTSRGESGQFHYRSCTDPFTQYQMSVFTHLGGSTCSVLDLSSYLCVTSQQLRKQPE